MDSKYCYPGTDVLINRYGIHDAAKLYAMELDITHIRAAELSTRPVKGNYDLKHLQMIHKKLFGDIYPFAGKIRDVRISKGNMFCFPEFIKPMAEDIFDKLARDQYLKGLDQDTFIDRLSFYMGEVNALHPFREGNGRTQRVFFTQLAQDAGHNLHFERMDKDELLQADIAGMAGDYSKLKAILNKHIEPIQKQSIRDKLDAAKEKCKEWPVKKVFKSKDLER